MLHNLKKIFLVLLLVAAFVWFVICCANLYVYTTEWAGMRLTTGYFVSQIIYFVLKNIPNLLAMIIAKHYWES